MVRIQRGWLVVALGLSTFGASTSAHAQKVATDDLSLLPADSEIVGGLHFAQLQTTVLWKQYVAPLLAGGDFQAQLNAVKAACKVDAMQLVTSLSFGIKLSGSDGAPEGVVVAHGVPRAKLVACYGREGKNELICLASDPNGKRFSVACYHRDLEPYMARGRELLAQKVTGQKRNDIRCHLRMAEDASRIGGLSMPSQVWHYDGVVGCEIRG